MTVGRFLRSLGYENIAAIKEELGSTIHQISWLVSDRYERITAVESSTNDAGSLGSLSVSLDLELKAIIDTYELARTGRFGTVSDLIAKADRVYVAGFQTVRGVAMDFAQRLEYARPDVRFVDGASGTYSELFADGAEKPLLIVVDVRRYAKQAMLLARKAAQSKIDLVIVTDPVCYWADGLSSHVFRIATDVEMFWESNGPVTTFLALLIDDIIRRLGVVVGDRGKKLQGLQEEFDSYVD